jgi:hypothetical protein
LPDDDLGDLSLQPRTRGRAAIEHLGRTEWRFQDWGGHGSEEPGAGASGSSGEPSTQ